MRLSKKEVFAIKSSFENIFQQKKYQIYLFGSRVDDSKKGGDIDLLVLVDEENRDFFIEAKTRTKIELFEKIDEQKVDITIATSAEMQKDPFLISIQPDLVLL